MYMTISFWCRFNHKAREDNRNVHLDVEGELEQILLEVSAVRSEAAL